MLKWVKVFPTNSMVFPSLIVPFPHLPPTYNHYCIEQKNGRKKKMCSSLLKCYHLLKLLLMPLIFIPFSSSVISSHHFQPTVTLKYKGTKKQYSIRLQLKVSFYISVKQFSIPFKMNKAKKESFMIKHTFDDDTHSDFIILHFYEANIWEHYQSG